MVARIVVGSEGESGQNLDLYQREWRSIRASLRGRDLLEMGMEPGPEIGKLLDQLLASRLDGQITDEAGERAVAALALASENYS